MPRCNLPVIPAEAGIQIILGTPYLILSRMHCYSMCDGMGKSIYSRIKYDVPRITL